MEQVNSLSLVHRHDGSYFYIKELGYSKGLYKYILADWQGNSLGKPIIIYSHTKRSKLSKVDQEFFDNNLLNKKRLNKYINKNLYIGGIERINNHPVRELREGIQINPNYKIYIRNSNHILIELVKDGQMKTYNIYEFINKKSLIDFQESSKIYSEKDFLNMAEETDYVINTLLSSKRVDEKIKNDNGYVGTVEIVNGRFRKVLKSK